MSNPTREQQMRRETAALAHGLQSEAGRTLMKFAEGRALRKIREASTPEEAWLAKCMLDAHDEFIGVVHIMAADGATVEREISGGVARAQGALHSNVAPIDMEYYRKAALEARRVADEQNKA